MGGSTRTYLCVDVMSTRSYVGAEHVEEACGNPLVSPALGSLYGLPPMWINAGVSVLHTRAQTQNIARHTGAGGDELMLDVITNFAEKASNAGIAPLVLDVDPRTHD